MYSNRLLQKALISTFHSQSKTLTLHSHFHFSSMAPTLYTTDLSPPARSVLLTGAALGIEFEEIHVDLFKKEHRNPNFIKLNPQHCLPTLVDEDGFVIWDSHAINGYLVHKYGKDDSLYPKDYKARAIVDQRLHFDNGVLFTRLSNLVRPFMYQGINTIEPFRIEEAIEAYDFLNTFLKDQDFLAGNNVTIADFCAVASTATLNELVPINSNTFPCVHAWFERLQKLTFYGKIQEKGLQHFRQYFGVCIKACRKTLDEN